MIPRAPLILLEGTCGAGKTTLLRALPPRIAGHEVRCVTQRETYGSIAPAEDAGTLDASMHAYLLQQVVTRITPEAADCSRLVVVDTLHATQFVRPGTLSLASFLDMDRQLHALGAVVVMLQISPASLRARTVVGRRGTGFHTYAQKYGADDDALTEYFTREQDRMLGVLRDHSCLPLVVLDGERPVMDLVEEVERLSRERSSVGTSA